MIELFISAFAALFVVIDPPGCAPIYASLTRGANAAQRRSMAIKAVVIAGLILLGFGLFGRPLLNALHIDLDSFRISGGLMLFLIAFDMVFEKRTQRREERAERIIESHEVEDISVFPMAMPMIAGPGSIATMMLLMSAQQGINATLVVAAAGGCVLLLTLIALLTATRLMSMLGADIEAVITRLLGVLLAAMAVQFIVDGLKNSFF